MVVISTGRSTFPLFSRRTYQSDFSIRNLLFPVKWGRVCGRESNLFRSIYFWNVAGLTDYRWSSLKVGEKN